jgi:predicted nucleic acid-binding protein
MTYLDTSVLVPLYINETGSVEARRLVASLPQTELALSEWSRAEFISAVGIRVRMQTLDRIEAKNVVVAFNRFALRALVLLPVELGDFALAAQYLEQFELGLRAGDALHLAIASNHDARMCSSDQIMLKCARRLGIKSRGLSH